MNFEIDLRPHRGERKEGEKIVSVEFDQFQIFVTGEDLKEVRGRDAELIGYVGKQIGSPINYLKVALAFGEPTIKVFTRMIKAALIDIAKQRVADALASAKESEDLLREVKQLAEDEKAMVIQEQEAVKMKAMAEGALEEANKELLDARELVKAEQEESSRRANEPDPAILNEVSQKANNSDNSPADAANTQNL